MVLYNMTGRQELHTAYLAVILEYVTWKARRSFLPYCMCIHRYLDTYDKEQLGRVLDARCLGVGLPYVPSPIHPPLSTLPYSGVGGTVASVGKVPT